MSLSAKFEQDLWEVMDSLLGVVDPDAAMALLLLKLLSAWHARKLEEYRSQYGGNEMRVDRAMGRERFILPIECTFQSLYEGRDADNLGERINSALRQLEMVNPRKLEGVFGSIDFNSAELGNAEERNARLRTLLNTLNDLEIVLTLQPESGSALHALDALKELGHWSEEPISRETSTTLPPKDVVMLMTRLVNPTSGERIYDPSCGTGGFLLHAAREVGSDDLALFGHEPRHRLWATSKMNLALAALDSADIRRSDPIRKPIVNKEDQLQKFDVVISAPPFALEDWGAESVTHDRLNRFHRGIPPKSSGDYAFITHAVETMQAQTGRAGLVLPLGVLFRGGTEGLIRRRLIEENRLDGVIRLPANILLGTLLPVILLMFKVSKPDTSVLFIDASSDFLDEKSRNRLRPSDIDKIVSAWESKKDIPGYSRRVSFEEIQGNDFNLNVSLYIKGADEKSVDLTALVARIQTLEKTWSEARSRLMAALKQLPQ